MNRLLFSKHYPLSKIIFFLFLFFLPQQFGPHFWPSFSYVYGIRLDYLSPFIYISSVLLILVICFSYKDLLKNNQAVSFITNTKTLAFFTLLLLPLLYTHSIPAFYFGFLKYVLVIYLGIYSSTQVTKSDLPIITWTLISAGIIQSVLSLTQFLNQGSLQGLFYLLGERSFSASSLHIAVMDSPFGLLVRPYGTFPHPNVLAHFLLVVSVLTLYYIQSTRSHTQKILAGISLVIIQTALFLTFSRILILADILFFSLYFIIFKTRNLKKIAAVLTVFFFCVSLYVFMFNLRFLNFSSLSVDMTARLQLTSIAISALKEYPMGLGINNYYYFEAGYQTQFSSVYLQPVHNIFLLLAAESGLIALVLFVYFLGLTIVKLWKISFQNGLKTFSIYCFIILIISLISGMFDHFLLTIWQSQLLSAIVLGFCWNKSLIKTKELG